ncbi:hypothetical protein FB446DRAFT_195342 [Lentinula raphanica]|nr:hypothetical protein FB446DRAFT_195342 [Lentinula raphanica]
MQVSSYIPEKRLYSFYGVIVALDTIVNSLSIPIICGGEPESFLYTYQYPNILLIKSASLGAIFQNRSGQGKRRQVSNVACSSFMIISQLYVLGTHRHGQSSNLEVRTTLRMSELHMK